MDAPRRVSTRDLIDPFAPLEGFCELLLIRHGRVERTRLFSCLPHVEDVAAFKARVCAAMDRIAAENIRRRIAVVCHGGVIELYLGCLFQSGCDLIVPLSFTSITTIRAADTRRVVLTVNDYAHLLAVQRRAPGSGDP